LGDLITKKNLKNGKKQSETYLEQYKYLKADFENYKKMMEKEKEIIIKNANEGILIELLSILDDMENAIKNSKNDNERNGIKIIFDNFLKILEKNGLKKIDTLNKKFDPFYHEALLKEKSDKEDGIIIEEIQKGYTFNDKVIRHSKVKISEKRGVKNGK